MAMGSMPIAVDGETDALVWSATLGLSSRFQLAMYGAAYLELARRRGVKLATLDGAFYRA